MKGGSLTNARIAHECIIPLRVLHVCSLCLELWVAGSRLGVVYSTKESYPYKPMVPRASAWLLSRRWGVVCNDK